MLRQCQDFVTGQSQMVTLLYDESDVSTDPMRAAAARGMLQAVSSAAACVETCQATVKRSRETEAGMATGLKRQCGLCVVDILVLRYTKTQVGIRSSATP